MFCSRPPEIRGERRKSPAGHAEGVPRILLLDLPALDHMPTFELSSVLPAEFRQDLEQLLYFNPLQRHVRPAIVHSIEMHGRPEVRDEHGWLQVSLDATPGVQTLFALAVDGDACALAGAAIYGREGERLRILHLMVAEGFSAWSRQTGCGLALRLVFAVRAVGRRLNGVRYLELPYLRARPRVLSPLSRPPDRSSYSALVDLQPTPDLSLLIGGEPAEARPVLTR
jgi:hypothetical protein